MKSMTFLFVLLSIILYLTTAAAAAENDEDHVLQFTPNNLLLKLNETKKVDVKLFTFFNETISISFTYGDENQVKNVSNGMINQIENLNFTDASQSQSIDITALQVGHLVVGAVSNEIKIGAGNVFRIDIIHSYFLKTLSETIGWIYFFAWSISFYPQVILNFKLKNVEGLSLDFISMNFLGHSCYFVFNMALFWIKDIQNQYFQQHPRGVNPVQITDVLFSMHAVILTFICIVQCIYYKSSTTKVSKITVGLLVIMIAFISVSSLVTAFSSKLTTLELIYFISYVKLAITLIKYIPQAFKNYQRKSTIGWSITNVLLDFTGGSFSLIQMFLLAYNFNDWTSIFGSPTKLGLSLFSIAFDILFIFQHYVLYRHSNSRGRTETDTEQIINQSGNDYADI